MKWYKKWFIFNFSYFLISYKNFFWCLTKKEMSCKSSLTIFLDGCFLSFTYPKMKLVECTELILQSQQPATLILNQSNWWQGAKDIFSTQLTFHSMTTHTSPLDIDFYNTLLSSPWEKNHCYVHTCLPTCYWCK